MGCAALGAYCRHMPVTPRARVPEYSHYGSYAYACAEQAALAVSGS